MRTQVIHALPRYQLPCVLMLGGVVAWLVAGCGSSPARAAAATTGSVHSRDVFRAGPRRDLLESKDGKRVQQRSATAMDALGRWTVHLHGAAKTAAQSEKIEGRTLVLERDSSGAVALVSLIDRGQGRCMAFRPPLGLMPPVLAGPMEHETRSEVDVSDARRPDKIVETGSARAVSRLIEGASGHVCVESVMNFEFSAAKIEQGRRFTFEPKGQVESLIEEEEWLTVRVGILTLTRMREVWHPAADQ